MTAKRLATYGYYKDPNKNARSKLLAFLFVAMAAGTTGANI